MSAPIDTTTSKPPRRPNSWHSRCRTGCVGVCLRTKTDRRIKGAHVAREFFQVVVGDALGKRRWLNFAIDTLGRTEAFRRAVRARAKYELQVRALRGEVVVGGRAA